MQILALAYVQAFSGKPNAIIRFGKPQSGACIVKGLKNKAGPNTRAGCLAVRNLVVLK